MQIGLGIGATFRRKWVPPLTEQIRSLLFNAGQQGGVYLFDKAHQASAFQGGAYDTPLSAVEQFIGSFYDLSGNGNHCAQATSTARAKWSARVNLLDKSEDFADAWWIKVRCTIALTGLSSPYDSPVHKLIANSAYSTHAVQSKSETIASSQRTAYVLAKAAEKSWIIIGVGSDITGLAYFDVLNGVKGNVTGGFTSQIVGLDDGWYLCSISGTIATSSDPAYSVYVTSGNGVAGYIGNNSDGVYIASADHRLAANSHLPYQRVTSPTDYDTAGFPPYLLPDGADDYYASASGGGSTTGIFICTAIAPMLAGAKQVIWSDASGNTGYELCINASNQVEFSAGTGSARVSCVSAALTLGAPKVITAQHDGTTLTVRVDGVATTAACGAASAGTAGTTLLQANGAASGYAKVQINGLVQRHGAQPSAELLTFTERHMANLQGRTL